MTIETLILHRLREIYTEVGFEQMVIRLDTLHDFASAGRLADVTALPAERVRDWLKEIVYVARETIAEIDVHSVPPRPVHPAGNGHAVKHIEVKKYV